MSFRFYTNLVSEASRNLAAWLFVFGLALIGFGFLVYVLRQIFALLAAAVFVFAGIGCAVTGVKIFFAQRKIDKAGNGSDAYRRNVQIHIEKHYDV
jgi:hypothetical protein